MVARVVAADPGPVVAEAYPHIEAASNQGFAAIAQAWAFEGLD